MAARKPDLSRIFPQPSEPPGQQVAAAPEEAAGARQGSSSAPIRGSIRLASQTAAADSSATLFVIARPAGATAGPPLAVRRIQAPDFPVDFEIGPSDVMIPSMKFSGEIQLTARLDRDGNPMTREPGDLQGSSASAVAPGTSGVEIELNERI